MHRISRSIRVFAYTVFGGALPLAAFAQNLVAVGQTPLEKRVGGAIHIVCPQVGAAVDGVRYDGTPQGDLFGHCNDLIHTANAIAGSGATTNSLGITAEELNGALDSIAHMQMPAIGKSASEISVVQAAVIGERLVALREGAEGVQIAANLVDYEGRSVVDADYPELASLGMVDAEGSESSRLGAFLNTRGGTGDRDGNSEELGFDFYDVGVTAGVDYRFLEQLVGGIAVGYTRGERDFDRSGGDLENDMVSGWLYGGFQQGGFYLDATYGYSRHWLDSQRRIFIPIGAPPPGSGAQGVSVSADGDTYVDEHLVSGSAGYDFEFGAFGIGPVTRLEYVNLEVDGFSESNASGLNLAYEDDRVESLIYNLGAEASYDISTGFGVLTPQVRAEWAHQFDDDPRELTARYVFDPSATEFFVKTRNPDRDYVDLGASLAAQFSGGFSAFLSYETILGHDDLSAHSFTLGGRIEF